MKTIWILLAVMCITCFGNETKAQLWRDNNQIIGDPHSHYANRNGTYYYNSNTNSNMGTSPNNAVYKNQAEFYNKDNTIQTLMPTPVGVHYSPGSQGYNFNGANFINSNTPGSYNNRDINGQNVPTHQGTPDPGMPKP